MILVCFWCVFGLIWGACSVTASNAGLGLAAAMALRCGDRQYGLCWQTALSPQSIRGIVCPRACRPLVDVDDWCSAPFAGTRLWAFFAKIDFAPPKFRANLVV